jgi:hypothetical protein
MLWLFFKVSLVYEVGSTSVYVALLFLFLWFMGLLVFVGFL